MRTLIILVLTFTACPVQAHGEFPSPLSIDFQETHPMAQWIITDEQGIFVNLKDGFRWLCEDAIAPNAGIRGLIISGENGRDWIVATTLGLFRSSDMGCGFERVGGVLGSHHVMGLRRHAGHDRWIAATASLGKYNDLFTSHDRGASWQRAGLQTASRFVGLHWAASDASRIYALTLDHILISRDGAASFQRQVLTVGGVEIPAKRIIQLVVSPQNAEHLLVSIDAGGRTRLLQSMDGGLTWGDVFLIPHPRVQLAFGPGGREALAVTHLGLTWRSQDGGMTWGAADDLPPNLGCLTLGPDGQTFWGCSSVYSGGPWVLAKSQDFGRSWTPALVAFEDATERWDCTGRDRATICCRGICPGALAPNECGQMAQADLPPTCDQEEGVPLSVVDAALDGHVLSVDAGSPPPRDAAITALVDVSFRDGAQPNPVHSTPPTGSGSTSGCSSTQEIPRVDILLLLFCLLGFCRRMRS